MRGLVYRELYLGRKKYLSAVGAYLLFAVMGILIRLSMDYGNLANMEKETFDSLNSSSYYIFCILSSVILLSGLMSDGGVIASDYKCRWNVYTYTLPVSEKKQAAVKYGIKAVGMLISLAVSIIYLLIYTSFCGREFDVRMIEYLLLITALYSIVACAVAPMYIKYKTANAVAGRLMGTGVIMCTIGAFVLKKNLESYRELGDDAFDKLLKDYLLNAFNKASDTAFIISPLIIIAVFALGFAFTVKLLKRREK